MAPDKNSKKKTKTRRTRKEPAMQEIRCAPSSEDEHDIVYFRRHPEDDPGETVPGREFRRACPPGVQGRLDRTLIAVAEAPPLKFSGGGLWEATRGVLSGRYEVRIDSAGTHYRLFCLLDYEAQGVDKPLLVIVDGRTKSFGEVLPDSEYQAVRDLGNEYLARNPRSIA